MAGDVSRVTTVAEAKEQLRRHLVLVTRFNQDNHTTTAPHMGRADEGSEY